MGLIVAAPTAGSAGVLPGMLFALQDRYNISDERLIDALFNAGAIGYLCHAQRNRCRRGRRLSGRGRHCLCDGGQRRLSS